MLFEGVRLAVPLGHGSFISFYYISLLYLVVQQLENLFSFDVHISNYLRCVLLQLWFMAEFSHIFADFDEVSLLPPFVGIVIICCCF